MDKYFLSRYIDMNFDVDFWERVAEKVGGSPEEARRRGKEYLLIWGEPTDDKPIKDAIRTVTQEDFSEACDKTIDELTVRKNALDG